MESIVDRLNNDDDIIRAQSSDSEEIIVPKLCAFCKNNAICSVLPTLISLSKIGIMIGVEECPYNTLKKTPKLVQTS